MLKGSQVARSGVRRNQSPANRRPGEPIIYRVGNRRCLNHPSQLVLGPRDPRFCKVVYTNEAHKVGYTMTVDATTNNAVLQNSQLKDEL